MSPRRPPELILPAEGQHDRVPAPLRAVVAGGGLAGVAAASVLAERGVSVVLAEREPYLGGRFTKARLRLIMGREPVDGLRHLRVARPVCRRCLRFAAVHNHHRPCPTR